MTEKVLKLSCHIDNGGNPIDQLWEGLKISLEGQVEKTSPSLGREAVYQKTSRINKLPQYLYINFVRFYWKQASASAGTDAQKAKILKNVAFPKVLDVWEFCTDELKASLNQGRKFEEKLREEEDTKALTGKTLGDNQEEKKDGGDVEMKDEEKKDVKPKLVGAMAKAAAEK